MKAQLLLQRRTCSLNAWATTAPNAEELLDPRDNQECEIYLLDPVEAYGGAYHNHN